MIVEVCFATATEQYLTSVEIPENACVEEAIFQSKILEKYPEIDLTVNKVGIFSRIVELSQPLRALDRIEIYRPLTIDPKEARLLRANAKLKKKVKKDDI